MFGLGLVRATLAPVAFPSDRLFLRLGALVPEALYIYVRSYRHRFKRRIKQDEG